MDDVTVIVVDENEDVCQGLARGLDRLSGIHVLASSPNPMLAGALAHQFAPDVILADFKLGAAKRPDMLRWLSRMSPDSSLIMYSSYYLDGERDEFQEAGVNLCLLKGMTSKELGRQIRYVGAAKRGKRQSEATSPG